MNSKDKSFKILIAGGGVAGLTLALMLEKFDIDYLLLEGHGEIAPAAGASIGLFPNGLRILDQLDCYEPLLQLFNDKNIVIKESSLRDESGKHVLCIRSFQEHLETRFVAYTLL